MNKGFVMKNHIKCPRCGYEKLTEDLVNHCPVCGLDIGIYNIDKACIFILIYGIVSFIACVFRNKLPLDLYDFISYNGLLALCLWLIVCIIMFFRALKRRGVTTDGFRTPETVEDVVEGRVKHVDYRRFKNVEGSLDKEFEQDISIAQNDDGITLYTKHPHHPFYNLKYKDIKEMSLSPKLELKLFIMILSGAILTTVIGPLWGIICGVILGIRVNNHLFIRANTGFDDIQVLLSGSEWDVKYIYENYLIEQKKLKIEGTDKE